MNKLKNGGRILFAVPFFYFGGSQLINAAQMTSIVPMVPGPGSQLLIVFVTGIVLLIAAISLLFQKYIYQATILLGIFLLFTALTIHFPHALNAIRQTERTESLSNMFKDLAMAGAAFFLAGSFGKNPSPHKKAA
jgi:putative oxidoreductase